MCCPPPPLPGTSPCTNRLHQEGYIFFAMMGVANLGVQPCLVRMKHMHLKKKSKTKITPVAGLTCPRRRLGRKSPTPWSSASTRRSDKCGTCACPLLTRLVVFRAVLSLASKGKVKTGWCRVIFALDSIGGCLAGTRVFVFVVFCTAGSLCLEALCHLLVPRSACHCTM